MLRFHSFAILCGLVFAGLPAAAADAVGFRAGAATSNITPPLGLPIIGGFVPGPSKHIHDELFARCIVLDDGQTRLALVVCDLLGVSHGTSRRAQELITKQTEIPADHVLICGTHTHSASSVLGTDRFRMDAPLDDYQQFVAKRIADGVQRATNLLRPAKFAVGTVAIPEHLFNRRWFLKPGTMPVNPFGSPDDQVRMNPAAGSSDLVKEAGPTDPNLTFLSFRELDGKPIALLASYSLHYVGGVPGVDISADYFGRFSEHYQQLAGTREQDPPFVPILANGTSGDINNINFRNPRPAQQPYEQMNLVARDVAEKVLAAEQKSQFSSDVSLAAVTRNPEIRFRQPDPQLMEWAEKTVAAGATRPADLSFIYAQRVQSLAEYPEFAPVTLQVLRIGDLVIGTMPNEVFCEIGLEFKERSPIQPALLMSLCHGYLGYLPPPHQLDLGGYETWPGTNVLERTASEIMLAELLEMAAEVKAK